MALNIFEPRYRLMVRRCMEGSRRLGMAVITTSDGLHEVATECEIVECQPLPDGCAPVLLPSLVTLFLMSTACSRCSSGIKLHSKSRQAVPCTACDSLQGKRGAELDLQSLPCKCSVCGA